MTSQWWLGLSGGLSKINQSSQALKTHLHLGLWKSATNVNGKTQHRDIPLFAPVAGLLWKWSQVAGTERWPVSQALKTHLHLGPRPFGSLQQMFNQALKTHLHLGLSIDDIRTNDEAVPRTWCS